jgi:hypothetical protein
LDKDTPKQESANGERSPDGTRHGQDSESRAYWQLQDAALNRARSSHSLRSKARRNGRETNGDSWKRISFILPRSEAQQRAREFLAKYPKSAYWSEVESWRELPGDMIEFTMRRLPSAD